MNTASVNRRVVNAQLGQALSSVRRLQQLGALSDADFQAGPDNYAVAEHHLRRALDVTLWRGST